MAFGTLIADVSTKDSADSTRGTEVLKRYWSLTKPDVTFLATTCVGLSFSIARVRVHNGFSFPILIHSVLGAWAVTAGAGACNQYFERRFDAQMNRTARRPIPSGLIRSRHALLFSIVLLGLGALYLFIAVNLLSAILALIGAGIYLAFYTPLKRKTPLCTIVGALAGATPPLIGWAAATGSLGWGAWILYFTLFLWQFPHFMAIARLFQDDYAQAGFRVLPNGPARGRFVRRFSIVPTALLILCSCVATATGFTGRGYLWFALPVLAAFLGLSVRLGRTMSAPDARRLLLASVVLLPGLLMMMLIG